MPDPLPLADMSENERRWLCRIFCALMNHVEGKLRWRAIPYHVFDLEYDDPIRFRRLAQYVEHELRGCMQRVHPEEAGRIHDRG